ncbi:hypothetical protein GBA52_014555, partial [Prunus armeniaca]
PNNPPQKPQNFLFSQPHYPNPNANLPNPQPPTASVFHHLLMGNPDFPSDIMFEILSRLPVKLLCRFRSVSKSWRSLIADPDFVKMHLNKAIENEDIFNQRRRLIFTNLSTSGVDGGMHNEFWIMKEYGMRESWTKIRSPIPYSVVRHSGFWKKSHDLLVFRDRLLLCNSNGPRFRNFSISGLPDLKLKKLGFTWRALFP